MTKSKSLTKFNIFSISKNKTFKNNVVLKILSILFITALSIVILYGVYIGIKKVTYMYSLKHDFYKLQEMGINVKNYNIKYCKHLKKKYIPKRFNIVTEKKQGEFMNKKMIGFIPDKHIILDIDTNDSLKSANFLIEKIPKDIACEKTPNGYHYYFENDTGNPIHTYVQLDIDGEKYSVDILGIDSLVTMSPSCIEGKNYYWINSIFTHKPAKLSENMWILDLIKNNKPFFRKLDGFDFNINIQNAFIIIDNLHIENHFRFIFEKIKVYHKKIKLLKGSIYIIDGNYYFLTKNSFNTYKNKKKMLYEINETISKLSPSCIIDLSIIYSNYLPSEKIFHIKSCIISNDFKNYKYDDFFPNYIELNNIYKKTNYLIHDTITITNYNSTNLKNEKYDIVKNDKTNKKLIGSESIYVTILLSNYFNIPCLCLTTTYNDNTDNINNINNINNIINSVNKNSNLNKSQKENINKLATNFTSLF
jgi:hypothetical protein